MKICIARLRSGIKYTQPLEHIVDSFCECIKYFMANNKNHDYSFYNITFDGSRPLRNIDAIKNADVIIVPSEAEFTYHIPNNMHPNQLARSNEHIAKVVPYLNGKKVIVLRSDRRDDQELYRKVLGNDFVYDEIDEIDFPNNIHSLKFHFINKKIFFMDTEKKYNFCYWGTEKRRGIDGKPSGDERHLILKEIRKSLGDKSRYIGRFGNIKPDRKFAPLISIIDDIAASNATLCFNWIDNKATTSRYIEAIACGCLPFVWKDYDSTGIFVKDDWQRVNSSCEFLVKSENIDPEYIVNTQLNFVRNMQSYITYMQLFEEHLKRKL